MKVLVVACLESDHLRFALSALDLWIPREDVIILNNGNTPERTGAIEDIAMRAGVPTLRQHAMFGDENTIGFIHEGIKAVCDLFRDETILKIDEDVVLFSQPERFAVEPGVLLVPNLTINNYTTRSYLKRFWPDLYDATLEHPWMWHWEQHPVTGLDLRRQLLDAIYGADPARLRSFCEQEGTVEEIGRDRWQECCLMGEPEDTDKRGISSTAIAFGASDYLELCGTEPGVEEILLANAVWDGRAFYRVDHGIYCHHVSYWPGRGEIIEMGDAVTRYLQAILDDCSGKASPVAP